ncbi:MAG: ABC transporter permease [Bryobacteraceae bacterium]
MRRLRRIWTRLVSLARRESSEQSLVKEMSAHLAMLEEDFQREGLSAEDAKWAARLAFGGLEQAKEQYRDQRGFVWLEQVLQDLRHATRSLYRSPGFSFIALLSLAFGIGVNTAIFTLLNGILLKQLPIPDANRVVQLEARDKAWMSAAFSYAQFVELRRQTGIFPEIVGFSSHRAVLDLGDDPQQVDLELVTGDYFSFFHAEPALGRLLTETDDRAEGASAVCILSYQTWRSRFSSDPRILGRIVRLDGSPFQVVGVVGPDFVGGELQTRYDLWVPTAMAQPLTWNARSNPHVIWLSALGKLRSGLSVDEARERLKVASKGINDVLPKDRANADVMFDFVDASKGYDNVRTELRSPLLILMAAVGLVLLIACANLTNLLLARANERSQEFSVKLSLGISRLRLMRQLIIESLLLNLVGGILAIAAARALLAVLLALFNAGENWQVMSVSMDPIVLAFTFAVCAFITLVVGAYPSWTAIRTDITPALKGAGATRTQKKFIRRAMIVVQITMAVVLIFAASAFAHSLRKLKTVDLGFDIEHVAVINIDFRGKEPVTGSAVLHDVLSRIRQVPGVESSDLTNPSMLSGASMTSEVESRNSSQTEAHKAENTHFVFASPGHFATLRMPLLRGRDFSDSDRKGTQPVAIVNERLAQILWPGQNPVGQQIVGGWNRENPVVVAVVGNSKYTDVREQAKPIVYEPLDQMAVMGVSLEVRSRMPLAQVEHQVRQFVATASDFQVANVSTMELLRDHGIAQDRLLTFLSVLFGLLGTTLALVGIYGLISYSVGRRTREIGIRISLGAQRYQILQMFLHEVMVLVAFGGTLGLPLALVVLNLLKTFLYNIPATDPASIAITLLVIALGSILAAFLPARRATNVHPTEALRCE